MMKSGLMYLGLAVGLASTAHAAFSPVPITSSSYTFDIVVEKTAPPPLNCFTSATMDGGTNNNSNTFYERGYDPTRPWTGLPPAGSTFTSQNDANRTYMMPPSYATNNAVFLMSNAVPTGTLTLSTPAMCSTVSLLYSDAGGNSTVSYVVHHADSTTESNAFTSIDWFNTTEPQVWTTMGRVNMDNGQFNTLNDTTRCKLFKYDIAVGNTSPVTSIDLTSIGPNRAVFFGVSVSNDGTSFTPVAVSGFNRDMVVEAGAPTASFIRGCNVTVDSGSTNVTGNTFYEKGFDPFDATTGLPVHGTTFTTGNMTFQMAPDYTVNNVVYLGNYAGYQSGSLSLNTPASLTSLAILSSAGNGPVSINYTITFSDTTTQTGNFSSLDWFNSATAAYVANGRCQPDTCAINSRNGGACKLWANAIGITGGPKVVTRIDFTYVSGGRSGIFAISGQSTAGGSFSPLAVSGYNADLIVENTQKLWPGNIFSATTATMDNGIQNYANTWFEAGWYTNSPEIGLPAAGTLLTSVSYPNRQYQMPPTFAGPNSVLIDTNHQSSSITPVAPFTATAISLLTAGASIGSGNLMSNICIIQHLDGTAETNLFFGYDWFDTGPAPAYITRGRMDNRFDTLNNQFNNQPRLFEYQMALNNTTSPVTNLVVQYKSARGANWTTYVLALSSSTDNVAPILQIPTYSITTYEGSNIVFGIPAGGSQPITYQWQTSTDNGATWSSVVDSATVTGSTTPALSFPSVGITNAAQYRLTASNAYGSVTNGPGTLTVYSSLGDVTKPGDPLTPFGGTGTGDGGPPAFIDNNVGLKCLISGLPSSNPVNCGFTVTPSIGRTTLRGIRLYTANDAPERDPASLIIEGSNDGGTTWNTIVPQMNLNLTGNRNGTGTATPNPLTQWMQEVTFYGNNSGYLMYRVTFPTLKGTPGMMQLAEVELLGFQTPSAPVILAQSPATMTLFAGASPTFYVKSEGFPTNLSYQWYQGASPISGATASSYTFSHVQLADSGKSFSCLITNSVGSTNTSASVISVIAAPTQSYPVAIMADNPTAFWRLDEGPDDGMGNTGKVAKDYAGGNNGQYSYTTLGAQGYNPLIDSDTAASFGGFVDVNGAVVDNYVGSIPDLDLYSPTNISRNFSAEAWVFGTAAQQVAGAGIVAAGYGGGGEQFALDCGGGNNALRFYFRDVAGNAHNVSGTNVVANDGKWHHVVAVLDESNTNQALYVDGLLSARSPLSAGLGVRSRTSALSIGSRQANATTNYNLNFVGSIDEVAMYGYALSSNQVLSHYYASQPAPQFLIQPTNTTVAENAPVTFYSQAYGPGTVGYQWFQSTDFGSTWTPMTGQTGPTLTINSVPNSYNSYMYQVGAANANGSNVSAVATLSVAVGAPYIVVDAPASLAIYTGRTNSIAVSVGGSAPFTYTWTKDGATVSDGNGISGAHSNVLTLANAQLGQSGNYQLSVANSQGGPALSSPCMVIVQSRPSFNTNGAGWGLNGDQNGTASPAVVDNGTLTLSYGAGSTARSAWYNYPLYIGAFYASFVYQDVGGGGADGAAFVIHNDSRGPAALGGSGGALGLGGITPSAELEFNIYGNNTPGIAYHIDGATGGYTSTYPVDPSSGNLIYASMLYVGGVAQITLRDPLLGASYTTNLNIGDLRTHLGSDSAWVGFTGADGGIVSTQTISNFVFVPFPVLTAKQTGPTTVTLSWPASVGGFSLQSKAAVSGGTWSTVGTAATLVNDSYQVQVTATGTQFYRLTLP